jgi:hypothetical protein
MPKGLKETSGLITIGFTVSETAANTFTEAKTDLQLNVLDREVFVVYGCVLDISAPDLVPGTNTDVFASVSTTSRSSVGNLSNSNVIATGANQIRSGGVGDGTAFSYSSSDAPPTQLEFLGVIATNDFYAQIAGTNNASAKGVSGRIYGVRARADADTFAALTQSELLSA